MGEDLNWKDNLIAIASAIGFVFMFFVGIMLMAPVMYYVTAWFKYWGY